MRNRSPAAKFSGGAKLGRGTAFGWRRATGLRRGQVQRWVTDWFPRQRKTTRIENCAGEGNPGKLVSRRFQCRHSPLPNDVMGSAKSEAVLRREPSIVDVPTNTRCRGERYVGG